MSHSIILIIYSISIIFGFGVLADELVKLNDLNFYASQNQYTTETFQKPFNLDHVTGRSLEMALQSCQESFKWQRWNCPSNDFFVRHSTPPPLPDREDVYVKAITTAAILYVMTKQCSHGLVAECPCAAVENSMTIPCSDNPNRTSELYEKFAQPKFTSSFHSKISKHNYNTIKTLIQESVHQQCGCAIETADGCVDQICLNVLKPFEEIAQQIRNMYDDSIHLTKATNVRILWENIPNESLIYSYDSPDYCKPDFTSEWPGMQGRECSRAIDRRMSREERKSCYKLCRACGYGVRKQIVVRERLCNCRSHSHSQRQCDKCISVETRLFCY